MNSRLLRGIATAVFSTVVLTSCAQPPVLTLDGTEILDWRSAKAETMEKQAEIVASIDPVHIVRIDARETGVLLSCKGDRMYSWAGGVDVTMNDPTQAEQTIRDLARTWGDRDGHRSTTRIDFAGDLVVRIEPTYGGSYLVGSVRDGELVDLDSFSRCFELPEGEWPGGSF